MRADDLIITVAYFSIPIQILVSLYQYPRLQVMPLSLLVLAVLFSLFIFLCGAGHLLRCMHYHDTTAYMVVNGITAFISLTTALYLLPLIPTVMSLIDKNLQDLIEMNSETEQSKQKLMTFMAFLCHEIRNPLFIITSTISFLEEEAEKLHQDRPDNNQQEQKQGDEGASLNLIKHSADLMLRLVNDVLDISRLESGEVEMSKCDFDLGQTIDGAVTIAEANIREKNKQKVAGCITVPLEFRCHVDPAVPQLVHGDPARLLQVCLNLLTNAVKFTDVGFVDFSVAVCDFDEALKNGRITLPPISVDDEDKTLIPQTSSERIETERSLLDGDVSVALLEEGNINPEANQWGNKKQNCASLMSDRTVLKIRVEDTGCGIPPEQLDRIFQPYTMAKLANYRQQGGTGLGLSIVKKLTGIMGGTVQARSSVGVGSVFEVYVLLEHPAFLSSLGSPSTAAATKSAATATTTTASDGQTKPKPSLLDVSKVTTGIPTDISTDADPLSQSTISTISISSRKEPIKKRLSLSKFDFESNDAVVLIVDDNLMNRKLLARMLKGFNLESQQASNGQEAVDAMLASRNYSNNPADPQICFVLMDLSMPVMGGCEAIEKIRSHGLVDVPIMALTAAVIEEDRDGAMEAGATDYSTKPILREELHAKCLQHIAP